MTDSTGWEEAGRLAKEKGRLEAQVSHMASTLRVLIVWAENDVADPKSVRNLCERTLRHVEGDQ